MLLIRLISQTGYKKKTRTALTAYRTLYQIFALILYLKIDLIILIHGKNTQGRFTQTKNFDLWRWIINQIMA